MSNLSEGVGYWVYAKTAFNLNYATNLAPTWGGLIGSVISAVSTPPTYSLVPDWNLIGFKSQPNATEPKTVGQFLLSINGTYYSASVWVYDNVNGVWVNASQSTTLYPGDGMWVYMKATGTLMPQ